MPRNIKPPHKIMKKLCFDKFKSRLLKTKITQLAVAFIVLFNVLAVPNQSFGLVNDVINPQIISNFSCLRVQFGTGQGIFKDIKDTIVGTLNCALNKLSYFIENIGAAWKKITDYSLNELIATVLNLIFSVFLAPIILIEQSIIIGLLDPRNFRFASSPLIHEGWYVSLTLANLIIVIGLLILANKIILGLESYGDYKKLIGYIWKAILINFSLTIASLIIGISNMLTIYFLDLVFVPTEANPIKTYFNAVDRMNQMNSVFVELSADTLPILGAAFNSFISLLFSLVVIVILAVIIYGLFKRILHLWILLIFAPLAWVLDTLLAVEIPGVGKVEKEWWDRFTNAVVFAPLMAFFLWFSLFVMAKVSFLYAEADPGSRSGNWIAKLLESFIFLGILIFGYDVSSKAGGEFVPSWGRKYITKLTGWAPETALKKYNYQKARFKNWITERKITQRIAAGIASSPVWSRVPGINRIPISVLGAKEKAKEELKGEADQQIKVLRDILSSTDEKTATMRLIGIANNAAMPSARRAAAAYLLSSEERYRKNIHEAFLNQDGSINMDNLRRFVDRAKNIAKANALEFKDDDIAKIYPTIKTDPAELRRAVSEMSAADLAASPVRTEGSVISNASKEQLSGAILRLKNKPTELRSFVSAIKASASESVKRELAEDRPVQTVILDNLGHLTTSEALEEALGELEQAYETLERINVSLRTDPSRPLSAEINTLVNSLRSSGIEIPLELNNALDNVLRASPMPSAPLIIGGTQGPSPQNREMQKLMPYLINLVSKARDIRAIMTVLS